MGTELKDALTKAIENKKNDINSFTWKLQNGKEVRLMDMSIDELQTAYNHCTDMLWNKDRFRPGKYVVRENIINTFNDCNAELFHRYLLNELGIMKTPKELIDFISDNKEINGVQSNDYITALFHNAPNEYESITVDKLLDAVLDKLGTLNRKMINDKFILSQGIWLTKQEKEDLTEYDNGKLRNFMDVIKERLVLNPSVRLRVNQSGLSYAEFRALVKIEEDAPKISSLATATLKLLRNKILFRLDEDLNYHIKMWLELKEKIEKVAEYKKINLTFKQY